MRSLPFLLLLTFSSFAQDLPGFTPLSTAKERAVEQKFDASLRRDELRDWLRRLSARPHHLGSNYDRENAEFLASLFKSWGYETTIETFDVLFPVPKTRVVEMLSPEKYTLKLAEPPLSQDATSGQTSEQLPSFNAYSTDGDVTSELVYVNYGIPADYEELAKHGVDVKGKIVIARYGNSWRGIKPKVAAEHGAVGCLIYSDPRDDGYFAGDVYPNGPFRNESGVQRGSVADMPLYPGDPLTPGVGATAEAKRLDRKDVQTITKIPVLPISYSDALPLLRALAGPVAPSDWRGALPITYHLGPGPARVHMNLEFDWKLVPARDVIARLPGSDRASEWVMRGNHHDAWVNGAMDPLSGLVAELAEARAIGELAKSGWRPRRTIVFAAWDGEEEGLLGSTEWVETHQEELKKHLVLYTNSDSYARGFLDAGGSHTLERFITQVARDVVDPEKNVSVFDRLRAHDVMNAKTAEERKEVLERTAIRLDALGSGSDYTPFLQHAGIPSLSMGYSGEGEGGSYHSIYDSFDHFTRFRDPSFDYGVLQAKTTGRITLRMANADLLPFDFTTMAATLGRYSEEVIHLAETMRKATDEKNRLLNERVMEIAADPTKPFVAPAAETPVPFLDFASLQNATAHLKKSADEFAKAYAVALNTAAPRGAAIDEALMQAELSLTRGEGLPRRPWYRHQIYAPGFYTGYGVKTLPAIREAIEQRNWREANEQIAVVAKVIDGYAAAIDRAAIVAKGE